MVVSICFFHWNFNKKIYLWIKLLYLIVFQFLSGKLISTTKLQFFKYEIKEIENIPNLNFSPFINVIVAKVQD